MKDTNESLASGRQTGSEPEGEDPAWGPHTLTPGSASPRSLAGSEPTALPARQSSLIHAKY